MTRVAIIGPGAIGGFIAAWLEKTGRHEVVWCGRRPLPELEIASPGGGFALAPEVITDPATAAPVDWVFIATKAYDVAGAARWLQHLVAAHTKIAVLQNGVEHVERFSSFADPSRILPVVVMISAERPVPSRILQRGPARMSVPDGELGRAFAALFADTPIEVSLPADFTTILWRKLCGNAPGVLNAILLQPTRAMHDEQVAALTREIARECAAVAKAEGARLDDNVVESVLQGCRRAPPDSINSLHADRLAGRPLETDARNGVIVRLGRKHGIPTPYNEMAILLLEAATRLDAKREDGDGSAVHT